MTSETPNDAWPLAKGVNPASIDAFALEAWPAGSVGTTTIEVSGRHCVVAQQIAPESIRPGGYISGPTQFSLADRAFWYACFGAIGLEPMAVTSELSIRFLRPAIGSLLHARAELSSVSRRTIAGSITVWTDDPQRLTSIAQGTYSRPAA